MIYKTAKEYISSLQNRGIVLGLDTIKLLLNCLGNPEKDFPIIHICGTNGKGSVGAYLSSIIHESGHTCGRFVSPCVGGYQNTFLLNDKPVCQQIVKQSLTKVKTAITQLENQDIFPTGFIAETALAFTIFSIIKPDYAIIECGMGGKDDATNVIETAKLSIISKISLDHTEYLGKTISDIAKNKSGIIKSNVPVVSAIQDIEAIKIIEAECANNNSDLYVADNPEIIKFNRNSTEFSISGQKYETQMLGTYQPENASLAVLAADVLGMPKIAIDKGIKNAQWNYRFERIGKFILDGAHNPDGALALAKSLEIYTNPQDTAFICACFNDKDYNALAQITAEYADAVYCITAPTSRGLDKDILQDAYYSAGANAYAEPTLEDAIAKARKYKNIVIFGTLSILSDARNIIERSENNATM